ncbi:hypothetical protein [Leuconostoc sp.]|uniref:hypothetical protein n=1 Tax=Leuconostoc sp. TaxID=1930076 RepID=UPI0029584E25|nr:hypothetical protein [Leuconostoc sp.]MDV8935941.1 hypothetical protein [Leuconostoc sp.]
MNSLLCKVKKIFKQIKEFFNLQVSKFGMLKVVIILINAPFFAIIQWSFAIVSLYKFITVVPWSEIVQVIFFTKDNQLNGVGTASALSVLLLAVNVWDGRRKAKKDLLSKSRIEWMTIVRPLIANYVTHVSKYMYLYYLFAFDRNPNTKNEKNKELTEKMEQIRSEYYQIILYVPKNDSNMLLLRNIENLFGEINNITNYYEHGINHGEINDVDPTPEQTLVDEYISKLISKTINDGGIYFKEEWERAKKGK